MQIAEISIWPMNQSKKVEYKIFRRSTKTRTGKRYK